jgi:hypothetical protein
MKQPMSQKELEALDIIAAMMMHLNINQPEEAYDCATSAIAARRAALIADAHVGVMVNKHRSDRWQCRCEFAALRYIESEYCESCHTRRPDAEVIP